MDTISTDGPIREIIGITLVKCLLFHYGLALPGMLLGEVSIREAPLHASLLLHQLNFIYLDSAPPTATTEGLNSSETRAHAIYIELYNNQHLSPLTSCQSGERLRVRSA